MKVTLARRFFFEAAHSNAHGDQRRARLHGHSYRVDIIVGGEVAAPAGWLMDYGDIKSAFLPYYRMLDHAHLNAIEGLEADTRLAAMRSWILSKLGDSLPGLLDVQVSIVGECAFLPVLVPAESSLDLPERWRFTFEAAQSLPQLSPEHPCFAMHGHSYRVEAGATDMKGLRDELAVVYEELDHRCLNDLTGLEGATCEQLCGWLWQRLETSCITPLAVVVQETESARCIYRGQ